MTPAEPMTYCIRWEVRHARAAKWEPWKECHRYYNNLHQAQLFYSWVKCLGAEKHPNNIRAVKLLRYDAGTYKEF